MYNLKLKMIYTLLCLTITIFVFPSNLLAEKVNSGDLLVEGASSGGGGGYVTRNSKILLNLVVDDLANEIKNASPWIFAGLPKEYSQVIFYKLVKNIRLEPKKNVTRDGIDLIFNYGIDNDDTPYIEALSPFFVMYGALPIKYLNNDKGNLQETILDLRVQLLHEVAHLFGIGTSQESDDEAEHYAIDFLKKLEKDFYVCMVNRNQLTQVPNILWVSPTDNYTDWSFNKILSNGWIYHQSKKKIVVPGGFSLTYYSHLDQQPLDKLKSAWNDQKLPGLNWSYFENNGRIFKDLKLSEKLTIQDRFGEEKINIKINFHENHGNFVFKSARVEVPLLKITKISPSAPLTMEGHILAPKGLYSNGTHEFNLACEYLGNLR